MTQPFNMYFGKPSHTCFNQWHGDCTIVRHHIISWTTTDTLRWKPMFVIYRYHRLFEAAFIQLKIQTVYDMTKEIQGPFHYIRHRIIMQKEDKPLSLIHMQSYATTVTKTWITSIYFNISTQASDDHCHIHPPKCNLWYDLNQNTVMSSIRTTWNKSSVKRLPLSSGFKSFKADGNLYSDAGYYVNNQLPDIKQCYEDIHRTRPLPWQCNFNPQC